MGRCIEWTEDQVVNIINRYLSGDVPKKIGQRHSCHQSTIVDLLKLYSIQTRSISESKTKYHCNHHFFKDFNEKSVYWAGFVVGDGSVQKRNCGQSELAIVLSKDDADHLYKFAHDIESNHPIRFYAENRIGKGHGTATFYIRSDNLVYDLEKFGVVPNKTLKTYYPDIPSIFDRHFIRGLLDSDGTICRFKNNQCKFALAGTLSLLTSVQEKLINNVGVGMTKIAQYTNSSNCYYLRYTGNKQVKLILDWLYKDATVLLDRKYNRYKEYCYK